MNKSFLLYKDLLIEIQVLESVLKNAEDEYNHILRNKLLSGPKGITTSKFDDNPVQEHPHRETAEKSLEGIGKAFTRYGELNQELQAKYKLKDEIEEYVSQFEGLQNKILYMRLVENKSLLDISLELEYSYDYVRKIHSQITQS